MPSRASGGSQAHGLSHERGHEEVATAMGCWQDRDDEHKPENTQAQGGEAPRVGLLAHSSSCDRETLVTRGPR